MAARVVCISRTSGARGEQIGQSVADALGFRYVDDEVILHAAGKAEIDPVQVAQVERRETLLTRLIDAIPHRPLVEPYLHEPHVARAGADVARDDLRRLIREAVYEIAARGSAVIVAHAASFALAEKPDVLRVLVTASTKERIRRVLREGGRMLSDEDAASAIHDSDAERAAYLRRFYDVRDELPTHYDLVINTDVLSSEAAAAAIVQAARA